MVPKESESEAAAQVLQAMAAEAGFDLRIHVTEFATSLKQAEAGEYQAYLLEWSGRSDPDGNVFNHLHSGAALNYSAWSNPAADKALEDARLTTDMQKRKAIYETLAREVLNDEPILYLYHRKFLFAHTTKLEGFRPMPDGLMRVIGLKLK
jgi:peptide/nickel transport system substrate-binding protein